MARGRLIKGSNLKFDPEFRFLLILDPALECWRDWAAQYWTTRPKANNHNNMQAALTAFMIEYLHGQDLHTLPLDEFFANGTTLPALDVALKLALTANEEARKTKHDYVSDFLDWVLLKRFSQPDSIGHRVLPGYLANPFPRRRVKSHGKGSDLTFAYVLKLDPKMEDWVTLAAQWLKDQKTAVDKRRASLDKFLVNYIHGQDLERNFGRFLLRETEKPDLVKVFIESKRDGTRTLQGADVTLNNNIANFLDWVLETRLGDPETGEWDRSRFHNPAPNQIRTCHKHPIGQGSPVHPLHSRTARDAGTGT
jgi:hypothetical protein